MRHERKRTLLGIAVVVVALIAGASYYEQVRSEQARATCQATLNNEFTQNITIRSQISQQQTDAVNTLLSGVSEIILHPATTPAGKVQQQSDFSRLFTNYENAVVANNEAKAANPYPDLTTC